MIQSESTMATLHEHSKCLTDLAIDGAVQGKVSRSKQSEKSTLPMLQLQMSESSETSRNLLPEGATMEFKCLQHQVDSST